MSPETQGWFWLAATLVTYLISRKMYRATGKYALSPALFVPAVLFLLAVPLHTDYSEYISHTGWLIGMLGPVTVAFAVPIWNQRALIARHRLALAGGIVVGSAVAISTSWFLADMLSLEPDVRLSLLPRSISTPFAMNVSSEIGGVPNLTAAFVMATGLTGAAFGSLVLRFLPIRSSTARGALFGVAAHGAGASRASEIGPEEGSIAGLLMVLTGLANLLVAPLIIGLFA